VSPRDSAGIKVSVILSESVADGGMIRLKGLDDDVGGVMGAANAANDLGQQLEGALARGKVR